MSITVEEGNSSEKSKQLAPALDELGFTKSRSIVRSHISAADKDDTAEVFDPSSCPGCKIIMERKDELRKQSLELRQTVLQHNQLEHGMEISESKVEKTVPRDSPRDILEVFKNIKYTGNLAPLSSRLPDPKTIQNGVPPPMPNVKRLKGEVAKSVGNKIDGCDWFVFHPYVDPSLPEELNSRDGGLKQA